MGNGTIGKMIDLLDQQVKRKARGVEEKFDDISTIQSKHHNLKQQVKSVIFTIRLHKATKQRLSSTDRWNQSWKAVHPKIEAMLAFHNSKKSSKKYLAHHTTLCSSNNPIPACKQATASKFAQSLFDCSTIAFEDSGAVDIASLEQIIQADYRDKKVAVLVSDLCGFTSTTRKYGVIHFASIVVRMRQLVLPIFARFKALTVQTEADNFITVFPDAASAVLAALEMQQILLKYNASLPDFRQHYCVRLNGIGVGYGAGIIMDAEGTLHGVPANTAYHMGEDICSDGDVLVTPVVADAIKADKRLSAQGAIVIEDNKAEDGQVYKKISVGSVPMQAELVSTKDVRFLPPQLALFAARHDPCMDLGELDQKIVEKFEKQFTVLMFHLDMEREAEKWGALQSISIKISLLKLLRPIFKKYNGSEVESELFIFRQSSEAVLSVLDAKEAITEYNNKLTETQKDKLALCVIGWGIHSGTMVVVDKTDIHWGDPVNTSSKLGQDLAENGELLISQRVYNAVAAHPKLSNGSVNFDPRMLKRSHVDFPCFCVTRNTAATSTAKKR